MKCKRCGTELLETDTICSNCGEIVIKSNDEQEESVLEDNTSNLDEMNESENTLTQDNEVVFKQEENTVNQNSYEPLNNSINTVKIQKRKMKLLPKILMIIGGLVVTVILLFVLIYFIVSIKSNKMICKSDEGNITLMYTDKGLTGYKAYNISYEFDQQKEYAKQMGIDAYLKEFNDWFKKNTTGSCTIKGKEVTGISTNNKNANTNNVNLVVVGSSKFGYVNVPRDWQRFVDVEGSDSFQYSYAGTFIVTLNVLDNSSTARDYASSYLYNMQNSNEVSDVTGATVQIGRNREYTAYQVYMYYPSDSTYLVTYWFETNDGKVRYIALEGPEELDGINITDLLYIPESFSLNK